MNKISNLFQYFNKFYNMSQLDNQITSKSWIATGQKNLTLYVFNVQKAFF